MAANDEQHLLACALRFALRRARAPSTVLAPARPIRSDRARCTGEQAGRRHRPRHNARVIAPEMPSAAVHFGPTRGARNHVPVSPGVERSVAAADTRRRATTAPEPSFGTRLPAGGSGACRSGARRGAVVAMFGAHIRCPSPALRRRCRPPPAERCRRRKRTQQPPVAELSNAPRVGSLVPTSATPPAAWSVVPFHRHRCPLVGTSS